MTAPPTDTGSDSTVEAAFSASRRAVKNPTRLAAVRATGLLDSEIEESFDRLTRLAVRLVKIPAAFVSLVDEDRDFYKSACGFGEPLASVRELEGLTFCHFTIQSTEPLIIPDTNKDPVYRHVPTVKSLGVAAYVGIPILVNGEVIGAFCAIDVVPHAWTADEVSTLQELAAVAVSEISLRASRAESERIRFEAERLAQELEKARTVAEEANRAKSDFLAAMSHDLRTPLNAIGGYAQLIELGVNGPINEQQRDSSSRILRAQRHLLKLIDDILAFAKSERGEIALQMTAVSIADVFESLASMVTGLAAAKQIDLKLEVVNSDKAGSQISVLGDFERVLQVLVNLATNAIKFTEEKGAISIAARRNGEWVELIVSDNGPGIATNDFELIFEPFVQLAGKPGTRGGVGLGLATSRELARRMGGDISVQSKLGSGAAFTFRLRAA